MVEWNLNPKYREKDVTDEALRVRGLDVDPAEGTVRYQRYVYVYRKGEIEAMFESVGDCKVERVFHDHGNWCVVARKLS